MEHPLIISCGIFKAELEYLLKKKGRSTSVRFLDPALHVNFDRLKECLVQALEESRRCSEPVTVLYGNCHPEMQKIIDHYGATKIDARNCIEAIVGRDELCRIDAEAKSFYLTAGWINNWREIFAAGVADLDLDFSSMFKDYKRVIVFDSGVIPIDEDMVAAFSRFTGLPVERRAISLDRLSRLLDP